MIKNTSAYFETALIPKMISTEGTFVANWQSISNLKISKTNVSGEAYFQFITKGRKCCGYIQT